MHIVAKHNQNANYFHCCATQELILKKAAEGDRNEEWVGVLGSTCMHMFQFRCQLRRFKS